MITVHLPTLDPEELAHALYRAHYGVPGADFSAWLRETTLVQDKWRDAAEAVLDLFKAAEAAEPERCIFRMLSVGQCGVLRADHKHMDRHHAFVAPKPEARESEGKRIVRCDVHGTREMVGVCCGQSQPQEPARVTDHLADAKAAIAKYEYDGPIVDAVRALIAHFEAERALRGES